MAGGRAGTWGFGVEATPGTAVAPSRWLEFTGEGFQYEREVIQGSGMRGARNYGRRASRRVVTAVGAMGSFSGELPTRSLGLLLQHMIGTTTPSIVQQGGASPVNAWLHTYTPGDLDGKSLTVQKRLPFATGGGASIHTYRGSKVTGWEISCSAGEIATIRCDFDSMDETTATAYTTPSYVDSSLFTFKDGTIYVGGTVATSGGIASRTGGTAVASVTGVTISGMNSLKTDRRFFGNQGVKSEQIENDYRAVSGSLETEFTDITMYDLYRNDTRSVVELRFVSSVEVVAGIPYEFRVLLPAVFLNGETPTISDTDVLTATAAFDAFEDGSNPLVQFQYMTADSAA